MPVAMLDLPDPIAPQARWPEKFQTHKSVKLFFTWKNGQPVDHGPYEKYAVFSAYARSFASLDDAEAEAEYIRGMYGDAISVHVVHEQWTVRIAPFDAWDHVLSPTTEFEDT